MVKSLEERWTTLHKTLLDLVEDSKKNSEKIKNLQHVYICIFNMQNGLEELREKIREIKSFN